MESLGHEDTRLSNPIHWQRQMRVICVGAGASGLLLAYKLQRSFDKFSLVIYEKNAQVSGTWTENRYPGVACDYPAVNYTYSFEPKGDWSSVYPGGSEVRQYFLDFATKYGLDRYCKLCHEVIGCKWRERDGKWLVQIKDVNSGRTIDDSCDILVNATGVLNSWRWPDITGLMDFEGQLLHSARWDEKIELAGKSVGVIGNGFVTSQQSTAKTRSVLILVTQIFRPTDNTGDLSHSRSSDALHPSRDMDLWCIRSRAS